MTDFVDETKRRIDARYADADVICLGGVAAGWQVTIDDLRRHGARSFLVLHTGLGTGSVPTGDDVELFDVGIEVPAGEIIEEFRTWSRLAADVPSRISEALDRFDPDHEVLLLTTPPTPLDHFDGRTIHGGRHPSWVALEDKTRVDDLFDRAGVPHPPSVVTTVADAPGAASRLDRGDGTVWSGDSREGFNGGATRVRWVVGDDDAEVMTGFFGVEHDRVRIAPFVEGVPCSIHGMVGATGIAVFRPCEMLIMRTPDRRFVYCGVATSWDPAPADRQAMRGAAHRVGEVLRHEVDFRGTFTVDGIMGADGFVGTEVNPRFGGGMARLAARIDELPIVELHRELIADPTFDPDADALERVVLGPADRERSASTWTFLSTPIEDSTTFRFALDGNRAVAVAPGQAAIEATVGPAVTGSMLRADLAEVAPDAGPMFAPLAIAALTAAAGIAGVEVPPMEAARPVR